MERANEGDILPLDNLVTGGGRGYFVTGTGTGVGKTYVAARLIAACRNAGINCGYFKAAMSGDSGGISDGDYVRDLCGLIEPVDFFVPYAYETPVSPHLAGALEGRVLELPRVEAAYEAVCRRYEMVVAEGSGGLFCPLTLGRETVLLEDVIRLAGLPLLIVAGAEVGAINAAVLTAAYADRQSLPAAGFLLNRFDPENPVHQDNRRCIERFTGLPVLQTISDGEARAD